MFVNIGSKNVVETKILALIFVYKIIYIPYNDDIWRIFVCLI